MLVGPNDLQSTLRPPAIMPIGLPAPRKVGRVSRWCFSIALAAMVGLFSSSVCMFTAAESSEVVLCCGSAPWPGRPVSRLISMTWAVD